MKRIDELTDSQRARFGEWADKWIEIGLRTGPADRHKFEDAARRCYEFAGIPWHGNVVWVSSPLVVALAAPAAEFAIQLTRNDAVRDAVRDAVHDAVRDAVGDAVHGAVRDAVGGAVGDAVRGAVGDAVRGAVHDAVHVAVHGAVHDAVRGAVGDAVHDAVRDAVRDAVHVAVHVAVGGAMGVAVGDAREVIRQTWGRILGGQFWAGYWWGGGARTSYFRDVADLELPGDLWDRARAHEATIESACWWSPHRDFIIVSERPVQISLEQVGPPGLGSHRLHGTDGPAIHWPDGWGIHAWHGTVVPPDLIETGWTTDRILTEPNAEIRRAAIERTGWDQFVTEAKLEHVHTAPDPANPGYELELFDVPTAIYDEPVRVVLMTNASPERDGTRRKFGLTVPATIGDALEAIAWTFDIPASTYAQLARAT